MPGLMPIERDTSASDRAGRGYELSLSARRRPLEDADGRLPSMACYSTERALRLTNVNKVYDLMYQIIGRSTA